MDQPLVSILINNYNYGSFLKSSIDSSLSQTYPNTEIIVVDDGSTDGSQEIIKSYGDKIKPVFKSNGGHASALNAGFRESRGDIICFLDSDDMFLASKVQEIVQTFHDLKDKDIDWVFHPLLWIQTDELEKEQFNKEQFNPVELDRAVTPIEIINFRDRMTSGEQPEFVPQNSALSYSRKILEKIFPLPEDRKIYIGDTYMSMGCVSRSKGCVIDKKLSIYRLHGNNGFSNQQMIKVREAFAMLHIVTGYWLRTNFPDLSTYTDKFFSKGLACFWLIKNPDVRYTKLVKDYFAYLSIPGKARLFLLSLYYFQKAFLTKNIP
jgi:glycosyltransferase involved in cell wall biosynthesis